LHQRSQPHGVGRGSGVVTTPDARFTQTPAPPSNRTWMTRYKHDWLAQRAPAGVLGFTISRGWANASTRPLTSGAVVKLTLFDVAAGRVRLTADGRDGTLPADLSEAVSTVGDRQLKTLTLLAPRLRALHADPPTVFDFEVRATDHHGDAVPLVLCMVRLVKLGDATPPARNGRRGGRFGDGVDMKGVVALFTLAGLLLTAALVAVGREKISRCSVSSASARERKQGTGRCQTTPAAHAPQQHPGHVEVVANAHVSLQVS